ncbi:iron complex transport system substrate-binding protein [Aeromonas sp. RU39B]|uniref:ABC transporter substrate-binding protein n=1 Tax=Aeromonas sp. RU39B TaxID=1907416 RepID=UPI000954793D|nr:ABC transporter substrate-binding protein [Aeromonas sp. RU39B]SIP96844.1 iron complex transport system substrate-binding protein [Aeromonas sp. RU39B]
MLSVKLLSKVVAALSLMLLAGLAQAKPTELVDVTGRKVTVDLPAKRIVLGFYIEDYFAVGGDAAYDRLAGMSRGWFVKSRPATWDLYVAKKPQLAKVPDLGSVQDQSFSIEKTLAVRPDVVILADWQYKALAPDLPRLEQAGIPIVVIDYNAQTLERHLASTRLLGEITGQPARAQQIADDYQHVVDTIQSRIAKAGQPKPRVYIELGDKGPAEYSYTYGKDMWGAMAALAGGDNIAAPFVDRWGPIHPEQLLASKPQVILMAGYESVTSAVAMQVGQDIDAANVLTRLKGFTQRPGWSDLPAVHDGRVYAVYHGATRSIMDAALLQFMAKALYPALFKDLDPKATYLGFYQRYLPIRPHGTFMLGLNGSDQI